MKRVRIGTWLVATLLGAGLLGPACSAANRSSSQGAGGLGGAGPSSGNGGHSNAVTAGGPGSGGGSGGARGITTTAGPGGGASTTSSTSAGGGSMGGHCDPTAEDLAGCGCPKDGMTRACYTASPKTRNVGLCKDGSQTCVGGGEFARWGACTGAITPTAQDCMSMSDGDCNGATGCADPACANNPACNGGCTDGQTRPCYDGPPGTEGTGACKPGTQTCAGGMWPPGCPGEVTPSKEVCSDLSDHNCNGLPGCFDFIVCFSDPACQPPPCMPQNGCTCPMGSGDQAVCPDGDYGDPQTGMCCPCSASTCDQLGCCGEAICAGSAVCAPLNCGGLAPACNGMVNVDCDFEDLASSDVNNPPEDCDQACCKCKPATCP